MTARKIEKANENYNSHMEWVFMTGVPVWERLVCFLCM
jgi:UDP-N-acetylglucosamine pyrophosphorylase